MARFEPNPEGLAQLGRHVQAKVQVVMDDKARAVIRQVNAEMNGRPVEEVLAALMTRMRAAGIEPDEANLGGYAQSISDGTCT